MKTLLISLLSILVIGLSEGQNAGVVQDEQPNIGWRMTWFFYGRVWGFYDVGIGIRGQDGYTPIAQSPEGAVCLGPIWNFESPSYLSSGGDCIQDMKATTWVIALAQHGTNFWIPVTSFNFNDLDADCCTFDNGNCNGSLDLGTLQGNCTGYVIEAASTISSR